MSDRSTSTFQRNQQTDDTVKAVATVFDRDAGRYERLLPSHVSLDDFRNAFLTSVQRNPRLLEADRGSFWLALQQAAGDGLKCDNREAALVIFSDTDDEDEDGAKKQVARSGKPKQVVYMPMVAGLRKLVRNTGLVSTIEAELIFKGEVVELWREDGKRHFKHVVNTSFDAIRSDGNIIGAYAVVNYKDGTWQVEWMSRGEIEKVRAVSRAKSARSPWQSWYSEMAKKTPLRRLIKQLDKSPEIAALDKALENDPTLGETIDGEAVEIAEAVAARPTETRRPTRSSPAETSTAQQGQQQASHTEQASQPSQTSRDTEDWRSNHGETTRDSTVGTQTASAATGETKSGPTTQERKPEPKPTAANDTAAKTAETTAADKTSPPVDQRSSETQQVDTASEKGAFEAWVVDAAGNETTPDPYADAMQFAAALAALCAGQTPDVISSIVDNNEGAIADCRDVSAPAAAIIDAAIIPKSSSDDRAIEDRVVEDQGGTQEQAETSTGAAPIVEALAVPLTPGGKPHWPNYTVAAKERLDQCRSVAEAEAWMAVNKPVFFGKCTIASENQIQRHYDQTLTKLSAGSDDAEPVDADRGLADKICAELKSSTTLDNLRAMNGRKEVIDALTRWQKDRPELFNELRTVGTQRLKELQAAG